MRFINDKKLFRNTELLRGQLFRITFYVLQLMDINCSSFKFFILLNYFTEAFAFSDSIKWCSNVGSVVLAKDFNEASEPPEASFLNSAMSF